MNITIKVKPHAREEKVEKISDTDFLVSTHATPEKGKANKEVIRLLARYFDIPPSHIAITSGHTSRIKTAAVLL